MIRIDCCKDVRVKFIAVGKMSALFDSHSGVRQDRQQRERGSDMQQRIRTLAAVVRPRQLVKFEFIYEACGFN